MSGRVYGFERRPFYRQLVTIGEPHRYDIGPCLFAHHSNAMSVVTQRAQARDVIGVQMCVHSLHEFEIQLLDEMKVAIDLLQHRIDDQSLAARTAREQVGIRTGDVIEELTKDHF